MFEQQVINGLSIGAVYALIALGYTMVYGILGFINFAHGDLFMLGAYWGFFLIGVLGFDLVPAMLLSMILTGICGVIIEKIAYRPLRRAGRLAPMISSIGVAITLQAGVLLLFGPQTERYPIETSFPLLTIAGARVSILQIIILVVALTLMLLLELLVQRTRIGTAMRATAENIEAAALMGVSADTVISLTFFLGSALGAAAGVLWAINYSAIAPTMGLLVGIKAFIAAVLGGIGSIRGAVLGGFILGLSEIFATAYISSSWRDAVAFILLIGILLVRPTGLLGAPVSKRA